MSSSANDYITEDERLQIETSKDCGPWVVKATLSSLYEDQLQRMLDDCQIQEKASDILSKFESAMHTSFAEYLATGKDVHWHDPSKGVPETPAECEAASAPLVNVNLYDGPELPERLTGAICSALAAADAQTALCDFQSEGMSLSARIKEGLGLSSGRQQRSWPLTRNKLTRDLERDSTLNILAAKGKKGGAGGSFDTASNWYRGEYPLRGVDIPAAVENAQVCVLYRSTDGPSRDLLEVRLAAQSDESKMRKPNASQALEESIGEPIIIFALDEELRSERWRAQGTSGVLNRVTRLAPRREEDNNC